MKKLLLKSALLLMITFLQFSCSNDTVTNNLPITSPVDVYVAGSKNGQACYWKNGQIVLLNSTGFENITVKKIIVSNSNTYLLGEGYSNQATNQLCSLFWKNGVLTNLTESFGFPSNNNTLGVTDMDVAGNDVYFSGYISGLTLPSQTISLVYWKNNQINVVRHYYDSFYNTVTFIKVLNNVVYISGRGLVNALGIANGFYTNNVYNQVDNAVITGFEVNNNQMIVYGSPDVGAFYFNVNTNVKTSVNFQTAGGIEKMCFDNNNVYYSNLQQIYKNGTIFYNNNTTQSFIIDYKILNDNFYKVATTGGVVPSDVLEINGVNIASTSANETFNSLFIVQN